MGNTIETSYHGGKPAPSVPTHVLDLDCPRGCGKRILVPCVETGSQTRDFGGTVIHEIKTIHAPTLHAQIAKHLGDCTC
jgi:hypothetical protein